jgi:hypothetical protein
MVKAWNPKILAIWGISYKGATMQETGVMCVSKFIYQTFVGLPSATNGLSERGIIYRLHKSDYSLVFGLEVA